MKFLEIDSPAGGVVLVERTPQKITACIGVAAQFIAKEGERNRPRLQRLHAANLAHLSRELVRVLREGEAEG